LTPALYYL